MYFLTFHGRIDLVAAMILAINVHGDLYVLFLFCFDLFVGL